MPEALTPKSKHTALEQRVTTLEQNPGGGSGGGGGGGYSELLRLGRPYPPRPTDEVIPAIGFEFVAGVDAVATAARLWVRLPDDAQNEQVTANVRLIVNDDDRTNIPITVHKGPFAEATAYFAGPVAITAGDRVGVIIQNYDPGGSPELLGGYTEAGDDYYGVGYQGLNGWITGASVSEPLSYTRVTDQDTGGTYPAVQLLATTGTPQLLPHAQFRRTFGNADGPQDDGWTLRDGKPNWGTLPAVIAEYDGQVYQAQLWPASPNPTTMDPQGAYTPSVVNTSQIGARGFAWVSGQLVFVDPDGAEHVVMFAPPE